MAHDFWSESWPVTVRSKQFSRLFLPFWNNLMNFSGCCHAWLNEDARALSVFRRWGVGHRLVSCPAWTYFTLELLRMTHLQYTLQRYSCQGFLSPQVIPSAEEYNPKNRKTPNIAPGVLISLIILQPDCETTKAADPTYWSSEAPRLRGNFAARSSGLSMFSDSTCSCSQVWKASAYACCKLASSFGRSSSRSSTSMM